MKYKKISENELLQNIGMNVRVKRTQERLSMEELAKKSNISTYTINNIENCKNEPKIVVLLKICAALGCSLEDLFY